VSTWAAVACWQYAAVLKDALLGLRNCQHTLRSKDVMLCSQVVRCLGTCMWLVVHPCAQPSLP
jgi:hypothetical protein